MTKIFLLVLMTATAVGCSPLTPKDCQKTHSLDSCTYNRSGKVSDNDIYGKQASGIKKALDMALTPPMPGAVKDVTCI